MILFLSECRRGLAFVSCLSLILFVACATTPPALTPKTSKAPLEQQIFRSPIAGRTDISTLDPALVTDFYSSQAVSMVFTGLVQLDNDLNVKGQLAQSWNQSSDGLTWTFQLKHGLKFNDGTPLTSHDVAYSIDRALQPATKSPSSAGYLGLIKDADKLLAGKRQTLLGESIITPDNNTLILLLKKKAAYFLQALTYPTSYTVEKRLIDMYGSRWTEHLDKGGGAGPFKVSQYVRGKEIVFVPNPNYYGSHPQLQKVIFPFYPSEATAYKSYQAGQVDTATVPSANLDQMRNQRKELRQVPLLDVLYYGMNYLAKPFDNIHIRQAFALAIDKDLIAQRVWKGSLLPTNHIVPQGMPGYNPDLKGIGGAGTKGNGTQAKLLLQQGLQEEGYVSVAQLPPIRFTYPNISQALANEVAVDVQTWRNVLGVRVKPDPVEVNKALEALVATKGNAQGLQLWINDWVASYPDPQNWTTFQFGKDSPFNNVNYGQNNTRTAVQQQNIQQQLEQADTNPDQDERFQAYHRAEQQLVNDVVWIPIGQFKLSYLLKPYVIGIVDNAQSLIPPDSWGSIYIARH